MGSSKKPHCQENLGPSKAQTSKTTLLQVKISKISDKCVRSAFEATKGPQ